MIHVENLVKSYSKKSSSTKVLDDLNLDVKAGEIFGIIGPSGSGKSTFLRCLNLLENFDSGKITIDGIDLKSLNQKSLRKLRTEMGMIFQNFNLLSNLTAGENIALPLKFMGFSKSKIDEKVFELLETVGLEDKKDNYPAQLSGGQKQRVGIARALALNPKILLCDEATSALDPFSTDSILNLIKKLNKTLNITVLVVTHEMDVITKICDRVGIISNGTIERIEVVDSPNFKAEKLFSNVFSVQKTLKKEISYGII